MVLNKYCGEKKQQHYLVTKKTLYFVFRDGFIFVLFNSGTSIYAGVVIFAVLGFMAGQQGVPVAEVAAGGNWFCLIILSEKCDFD